MRANHPVNADAVQAAHRSHGAGYWEHSAPMTCLLFLYPRLSLPWCPLGIVSGQKDIW